VYSYYVVNADQEVPLCVPRLFSLSMLFWSSFLISFCSSFCEFVRLYLICVSLFRLFVVSVVVLFWFLVVSVWHLSYEFLFFCMQWLHLFFTARIDCLSEDTTRQRRFSESGDFFL
jgi:hypothetical protein